MTHEPMERDAALGEALADVIGNPMDNQARWAELRRVTNARASSELARRRVRRLPRFALPASIAAGIALFLLIARSPDQAGVQIATNGFTSGGVTIDELLDANVSDGQFRALVAGAADTNELLLIAAGEGQ